MNPAAINAPRTKGGDLQGGKKNQYGENRHIAGKGGGNKATNKGSDKSGMGRKHP